MSLVTGELYEIFMIPYPGSGPLFGMYALGLGFTNDGETNFDYFYSFYISNNEITK